MGLIKDSQSDIPSCIGCIIIDDVVDDAECGRLCLLPDKEKDGRIVGDDDAKYGCWI
jgi:hypothetical protein